VKGCAPEVPGYWESNMTATKRECFTLRNHRLRTDKSHFKIMILKLKSRKLIPPTENETIFLMHTDMCKDSIKKLLIITII
jgi:hypothetical protein